MIRVEGKKFYDGCGEILFRGIGIGSWLNLEHFMMGIPGCDFQMRQTIRDVFGGKTEQSFYDRFVRQFISEADFRFLKSLGINLVRVPFNYHLFVDDLHPGTLKKEGFAYFDYLLDLCEAYGIYALPDLHAAPGGQNPDWHSDNGTGYTLFWEYDVFQEQVVQLWKEIARHYADREYLLGYDLLNEPFLIPDYLDTDGGQDPATGLPTARQNRKLALFYRRVTEAIRSVDERHIIFLEGDHFASDFTCLEGDISDAQTALTFHYYPTVWYENLFDPDYDPGLRAARFEEVFAGLVRIRDTFGRPVLCGEAGYDIANNGLKLCMELVEATLSLFAKYRVSFTLWSYKDAAFMGMACPKADSPWMQMASEVRKSWSHYTGMTLADEALERLLRGAYPRLTDEEKYQLSFRQRAILYPAEQRYIFRPILEKLGKERLLLLPDSFAFDQCSICGEYAEQYKNFHFSEEVTRTQSGHHHRH